MSPVLEFERFRQIVRDAIPESFASLVDTMGDMTSLEDVDSVAHAEIQLGLETTLDVSVSCEQFNCCRTFGELYRKVQSLLPAVAT